MTAGEHKDADDSHKCPQVTVLSDGLNVWPCDDGKSEATRENGKAHDPSHPVDRPLDRRVRAVGEMAGDPCVNLLSDLGSIVQLARNRAAQ